MRNPSNVLMAALLAAAVPAFPQPATPGTSSPHSSGDWGKTAEENDGNARRIVKRLLDEAKLEVYFVANYRNGTNKDFKVAYTKTPDFEVDFDNKLVGGSPAAAFGAGLGLNSPGSKYFKGVDHSGNDLIYSTQALYEMADQAEAAVFLAHEIGHLALGHPKKLEQEKARIAGEEYDKWEVSHTVSDAEAPESKVRRFMQDSKQAIQDRLAAVQAPMEEEADAYGRELSVRAKFPAAAAEKAFARAQDWLWVYKLEMEDKAHGASVKQRAKESAVWAAAYEKAQEKKKTEARRAKCASEGQSCE